MDNFFIQLIEILTISSYVLLIVGPLLICVAFLTYLERKVIAAVQYRKGPNVVGMFGLLQPFADGVKLFSKETIIPASANKVIFILAPMVSFALSLVAWSVIPISENLVLADINVGIFIYFCHIFTFNLWCNNGRLGKQFKIRLFRCIKVNSPDGFLKYQ